MSGDNQLFFLTRFFLAGAAAFLVAFVAVEVVSRTATVALVFGLLAAYLPFAIIAGRARRRRRELAEVWPEAVDNLASAVRAGMSLPEALTQLGQRGPEPLREPLLELRRRYSTRPGEADIKLVDEERPQWSGQVVARSCALPSCLLRA